MLSERAVNRWIFLTCANALDIHPLCKNLIVININYISLLLNTYISYIYIGSTFGQVVSGTNRCSVVRGISKIGKNAIATRHVAKHGGTATGFILVLHVHCNTHHMREKIYIYIDALAT